MQPGFTKTQHMQNKTVTKKSEKIKTPNTEQSWNI